MSDSLIYFDSPLLCPAIELVAVEFDSTSKVRISLNESGSLHYARAPISRLFGNNDCALMSFI